MAKVPKYEQHPLSAEYEDMTGQQWLDFLEAFEINGFDPERPIVLHDGMVLDGWQRYRACVQLGIAPTFKEFDGDDAESYVEMANLHRRQLDSSTILRRATLRRERVAEARASGKSIRAIAEKEGVSPTTIDRDLSTVPPGTADSPDGEITGKDGKKRKARTRKRKNTPKKTKPLKPPKMCKRCTGIGAASCDKCRKKVQEYHDLMAERTPPPTEEGKLDFVAVPFAGMRENVQSILTHANSALRLMEETGCSEFNKVKSWAYELDTTINIWHKRAARLEEQKHHEAKRKAR